MSNFISWALGELDEKDAFVEKVPASNDVKEETPYTETLKVEGKESEPFMETLEVEDKKSTSIPMELIKKIDKAESDYNSMETLKVKSDEPKEDTILTKLNSISMEDYSKSGDIKRLKVESQTKPTEFIEELKKTASMELDEYFKNSSSIESLGPDYDKAVKDIAEIMSNNIDQEPLAINETYKDYFDKVKGYIQSLSIPDDKKSEVESSLAELKSRVIEQLKMEYQEKNPNSTITTDDIEKLEFKISNYPNTAISTLNFYAPSSSDIEKVKLDANFSKNSTPGDKDFYEKYAEYVKPLNGDVYTLGVSGLLGLASIGDVDPKIIDGIGRAADTLYSRFGLNNSARSASYTVSEFNSYMEVALQILQRSKSGIKGGYFPFTAENLIFASTFWYFLDPLKYKLMITNVGQGGNTRLNLITYSKIYEYLKVQIGGNYDDPFYSTELKAINKLSLPPNFKVLKFSGRDSVKGLELPGVGNWDVELVPEMVCGVKPPEMIPWNVPFEAKDCDKTEVQHKWLPIDSFNIEVNDVKSSDEMNFYGVKSVSLPSIGWSLSGQLEFKETSRLWFNRWRKKYIEFLYGSDNIGSYILHPYQQCCYRLTIYLFDSMDYMTFSQEKDRFLKKFILIILPKVGKESYTTKVDDSVTLPFDIVGGVTNSFLKLGEVSNANPF